MQSVLGNMSKNAIGYRSTETCCVTFALNYRLPSNINDNSNSSGGMVLARHQRPQRNPYPSIIAIYSGGGVGRSLLFCSGLGGCTTVTGV